MIDMTNNKIIVAGNQWFSKYLIEQLADVNIYPTLIINISPENSSHISGYEDLKPLADKYNIQIYRPFNFGLNNEKDQNNLLSIPMDIMIVFGWQRLIPKWLIQHVKNGVFGVHGGPEKPPRCRGHAVFNWALILGCQQFYMYLFQITERVDDGDIIDISEFSITPYDDIQILYHKNCIVSTRMILNNLQSLLDGSFSKNKQVGKPSYMPRRRPENGGIDWTWPVERIQNLIRALTPPYPGAYTKLNDLIIKIYHGHIFDDKISFIGKPGEVLDVFPCGHFIVMTGDFPLYVKHFSYSGYNIIQKGIIFNEKCGIAIADPNY